VLLDLEEHSMRSWVGVLTDSSAAGGIQRTR
jgi:hypothetical protein